MEQAISPLLCAHVPLPSVLGAQCKEGLQEQQISLRLLNSILLWSSQTNIFFGR